MNCLKNFSIIDKDPKQMPYMNICNMEVCLLRYYRMKIQKKQYLKGLFETTYFKDIIEHNKLKKTENLDELCTILSDLTGQLLNSKKLSNTFKSVNHENIDAQTIEKYIQYFKDAFILQEANRYDIRGTKLVH